MQRKIWSILAILIVTVGFSGCSADTKESELVKQTIYNESVPLAGDIITMSSGKQTEYSSDIISQGYAYQKLTQQEKHVYEEILDLLINQTSEGKTSTKNKDTVKKVFQCVMDDHPELFYVSGYQCTTHTLAGNVTKIIIYPTYEMNQETIAGFQSQIDSYVKKCFAGMNEKASDYAKVRYLYEYVILNTEYKKDAENRLNICSVFVNHESVCRGYAKALQYLCLKAGIETAFVNGYLQEVGHAWNLVKLEGEWYYVDVMSGDASYVADQEENIANHVPPISYDYLCVTTEMILKTHTIDNVVPLPECKASKYNYFVQENRYFEQYDEEQMKALFVEAWEQGELYLTIRCADQGSFQEIKQHLIEEQKVFSFIGNPSISIGYAQNEEMYTLSFWTY